MTMKLTDLDPSAALLLASTQVLALVIDPQQNICLASPAFLTAAGCTSEGIVGRPYRALLQPAADQPNGPPQPLTTPFEAALLVPPSPEGPNRAAPLVAWNPLPLPAGAGQPGGGPNPFYTLLVGTPLSPTLQARLGLAEAVNNLPVAIWGIDTSRTICLAEGQMLADLPAAPSAWIGMPLASIPNLSPQVLADIERAFGGESFTNQIISIEGQPYEAYFTPLVAPAPNGAHPGAVTQVNILVYNVTDRVQTERVLAELNAQLERANAELEARVAERTAQLHKSNRQINESNSRLERLNLNLAWELAERERAEKAHHLSEAKFRTIYELNVLPICFWNAEGRLTAANDSFLDLTGFTRAELEAGTINWENLSAPASRPAGQRAVKESPPGQPFTPFERELVLRDGQSLPVLIGGLGFPSSPGEGMAYLVDLTERKRLEEEQMHHLERLDLLLELSKNIMAAPNISGILQAIADSACLLTSSRTAVVGHGVKDGELKIGAITQTDSDNCPLVAQFGPQENGLDHYILTTGTTLRLNGGELAAHPAWRGLPANHPQVRNLLGAPLLDPGSLPGGLIMVANKVEDQEPADYTPEDEALLEQLAALASLSLQQMEARAAAELRADELNAVIRSMAEAVLIYNAEGSLLQTNPAAVSMLGFDPLPYKRVDLNQRIRTRYMNGQPTLIQELASSRALAGEVVQDQRFFITNASGEDRIILTSSAPLYFDDQINGAVVVFHDVTERELGQEALRMYAFQLEVANQELQDFAFIASHDLQEPLRKIQAFGDRLQVDLAPHLAGAQLDYLERMMKSASHMQMMVKDLLSYSRIQTRPQPFSAVRLSVPLQQALDQLAEEIKDAGAVIEINTHLPDSPFDEGLPVVEADANQMRQLFFQLLDNALKFRRPEAEPHIRVYLAAPQGGSAGGAHPSLTVAIEDNGIGFDEKYADRIFQPFQRLQNRSEYPGTGMGLAICRKIIQRHNGNITVHSQPHAGTTVSITLPIRQP